MKGERGVDRRAFLSRGAGIGSAMYVVGPMGLDFLGFFFTNPVIGYVLKSVGVVALAGSPHASRLENLEIEGSPIGDEAAMALARSENLPRLRKLSVDGRGVSGETRKALKQRFGDVRITW